MGIQFLQAEEGQEWGIRNHKDPVLLGNGSGWEAILPSLTWLLQLTESKHTLAAPMQSLQCLQDPPD